MPWLHELRRNLSFALGVLRAKPFNVLLQVTNRCNMRCAFCTFWSKPAPPEEELTLADYYRDIVEHLPDWQRLDV